tara:strand:- start:78 stop:812 length:735 start_codon:yes stop_codon:yes gene_type:complete
MTKFNLDGTTSPTEEDLNSQESLKNEVDQFASLLNDNIELLRDWRQGELKETDWMAFEDSPTMSDAWKDYRQKLRNLPVATDASSFRIPDADFPIAPGQSSIPSNALKFVKSSDTLGIGTTSWIGINTNGEYFRQEKPTLSATVSTASSIYSAGSTANIEFKVNTVNMAVQADYPWKTVGSDPATDGVSGYVTVTPDSTTHQGIGTISVSIGSTIWGQVTTDGTMTLSVNVTNNIISSTVGVTT